jgi:hypothetical protein
LNGKTGGTLEGPFQQAYALALAYNDLTLKNIMIDEYDTPVVIDYGSCQPFGRTLITWGTLGWIDKDFTTSEQKHDEIGLNKIQAWLKEREKETDSRRIREQDYCE